MNAILERISAIAGVKGTFLVDRTRVLARRFPAYLTTDALAETAPPLGRVFDVAGKLSLEVSRLVLSYEDSRLFVERLDADHFLVLWLESDGESRALVDLVEASRQELLAALGRADADAGMEQGGAARTGGEEKTPGVSAQGGGQARGDERAWTTEEKAFLREALARYVGPVASLIVDAAMRSVRTWPVLVETLAREIELPQEREAFILDVERVYPTRGNEKADA